MVGFNFFFEPIYALFKFLLFVFSLSFENLELSLFNLVALHLICKIIIHLLFLHLMELLQLRHLKLQACNARFIAPFMFSKGIMESFDLIRSFLFLFFKLTPPITSLFVQFNYMLPVLLQRTLHNMPILFDQFGNLLNRCHFELQLLRGMIRAGKQIPEDVCTR